MNNPTDNKGLLFMAYDGDNAGRLVGRAILANDADSLHEVSARINHGHDIVSQWVTAHGGQVISGGGDEGTFTIPQDALEHIEELRKDYQYATQLTMTVGAGASLSEAGRSLMVGKFRGKDQVVIYDESIDNEIKEAQARVADGTGSDEEKKLGEAYLDSDDSEDTAGDANGEEVPGDGEADDEETEGEEKQAEVGVDEAQSEGDEESEEDSNSEEGEAAPEEKEPAAPTDRAPEKKPTDKAPDKKEKPKEDKPGKEKPMKKSEETQQADNKKKPSKKVPPKKDEASEQAPDDTEAPEDNEDGTPTPGEPGEEEAISELENGIDNPGSEQEERDLMDNIDDTDLAIGHETEDNASRPDGFSEQNAPGDMGEDHENVTSQEEGIDGEGEGEEDGQDDSGEEDGEFGDVLQDGLNDGADDIQKEKIFQLVAQALQGFKNQQAILERAKEQAPELYQSTINMLKCMIEMAKMLGNGGEQEQGADIFSDNQDASGDEDTMASTEDADAEGEPTDEESEGQEKPAFGGKKSEGKEKPEGKDKKSDGKGKPAFGQSKDKKPASKEDEGKKKDQMTGGLGKLPSKNTTKHVARTTMAPGSINAKGQQKIIDPTTGNTRWIDRKKGSVMSTTGIPIRNPDKPGES